MEHGFLMISTEVERVIRLSGETITINKQYMRNSTIVYPLKMEYGWKIVILGLEIMVKNGLEIIFLRSFHTEAIFF